MKKKPTIEDKLERGYEQLLIHLKKYVKQHNLPDAWQEAKVTLGKIGDLTHEEVETVAKYLQRDLIEAADFLTETEQGLINWIKFDWALTEARLWDNFSYVADKTALDRQTLAFRLKRGPLYKSGEIVGIATLQCDDCGQLLHFHKVSHIPPCPHCHNGEYSRISQTT